MDHSYQFKKKKSLPGHRVGTDEQEHNDRVMSPLITHYIMSYFKNDATISACRTYIETQVFEGMYDMIIEVGLRNVGQNERPEFFNNPAFKGALRSFFSDARAFLYVIGAVPLWFYSDPRNWLRLYMNARTMRDRAAIGLPFGVMDITKCYIKEVAIGAHGMHNAFKVVPVDGVNHAGLDYTLYNINMNLVDIDPDVSKEAKKFHARLPTETKQRIDTMTEFPRMAMPHSNFYDLVLARKLVDQAERCMHDANWARAHPLAWLTSEPPATLPGADSMTDDALMGGGDIEETQLAMRQRLSSIMNERARHSVQRIKEQINGGEGLDPEADPRGLTRRTAQKRAYGRMDALDDAFVFDDSIRVAKIDPADVIVDMTIVTKVYTERIYQQMSLPNDIFVTQRALNYRSSEGSEKSLFSNSLSSTISDPMHQRARIDQRIFENLFAQVGTAPFEMYHMDKIIDMVDEKDKAMDSLMNQVRAAIDKHLSGHMDKDVLYRETPKMIMKQIKAMLKAEDEKKATATEDAMDVEGEDKAEDLRDIIGKIKAALRLVNKFQVSAQGLKYYMLGLQSHNPSAQSIARLQFEEREEFVEAREQEEERFEMEHPPPAPAAPKAKPAKKAAKKKPTAEKKKKKKTEKPKAKPAGEKKAKPAKKEKASKPEGAKKDAKPASEKKDKPASDKKDKPASDKKDKPSGDKKDDKPKKKKKTDTATKKRKREDSDSDSDDDKPKKKKQKKDDESDDSSSDDSDSDDSSDDSADNSDDSDSDESKEKPNKKKKPSTKKE